MDDKVAGFLEQALGGKTVEHDGAGERRHD